MGTRTHGGIGRRLRWPRIRWSRLGCHNGAQVSIRDSIADCDQSLNNSL
ncbi:MAG: hypothetical protein GF311_27590 [Candidatus Lokiarchaeota archaeon]|nr:hypothetical protein [Candidatus Lokiarchaeota archaeon]